MKKILFSLSVILSVTANAQTISQAANEPTPWDPPYTTLQCDSVSPGGSGAAQTWNYSAIGIHASIQKTYAYSINTNSVYAPAYVFVNSGINDNSYYKSNGNILNYYGGNFVMSTASGPAYVNLIYSTPSIRAVYPMSISTSSMATVSGSIAVTGAVPASGTFTGTSSVSANSSGTLALAGRTFTDILRVMTTQTLNATISGLPVTVTQQNYDYISAAFAKTPVFTISTSTLSSLIGGTSTQTIVTVNKDYLVVGINETKKQTIDLTVFPNPATSIINFNTTSLEATKIIAYDLTGKIIATEFIDMGKAKMNINHLSNGLYLYSVVGKSNQILATGKFNVSK